MSEVQACPDERPDPPPPIDTGRHGLVLLGGMEPTLRSLETAFARAARRLYIETYILSHDRMGQWLVEQLLAAMRRGVDVRLLYDPLGSQETDPQFFERLRREGLTMRAYRGPSVVLSTAAPFPRDHGRVFLVDDQAWTGGMAFRDWWLPVDRGGDGWHDVAVQVAWGPVVEDFARVFETRWREALGEGTPGDVETHDAYSDLELVADCPNHQAKVYEHHRRRIRHARRRVWMEHAYFFPPPAMLQDLVDAARRGVDVRVMMPEKSDLPSVSDAARHEYETWIHHGIRIFSYTRCMNHAKVALVDDDWCSIGTFNANPTSMALANEVNLFIYDRRFVDAVAAHMEHDMTHCFEVDPQHVRKRSLFEQVRLRLRNDILNLGDLVFGPREDRCRSSRF